MGFNKALNVLFDLNSVKIEDNLPYIYMDGCVCNSYPKMLDTYLSFPNRLPEGKTVVFDIGGTNLRSALVSFDKKGNACIECFESSSILEYMTDFDGFVAHLASRIISLRDGNAKSARIRICFSYPFLSTVDHDAKIISMTKDVKMKGVEGKLLGASLREILSSKCISADIAVVNDATAAVLFVKSAIPDIELSSALVYGIIIGTGNNMALLKGESGDYKIINTEFGQSSIGDGRVLEHITGGRYIHNVVNDALLNRGIKLKNTIEVSALLKNESTSLEVKEIVSGVVRKIAASEAYFVDKIITFQKGVEGKNTVYLNIEGTCYYNLPGYSENFTQIMEECAMISGYAVKFIVPCENSIMIATASA